MHVWSKLSSEKWTDAWQERFSGGGQGNLVINQVPGRKTIRLELYCPSAQVAKRVHKEFGGSIRELKNQNWAALAPDPPAPVKIRDAFVICAARTQSEQREARRSFPGREVICVPPDMAFGTGHHATTASVLRMLVDVARERNRHGDGTWSLADLGCGSGILAMAADKLGADPVWGCDFDPAAIRVAVANAKRNRTPDVVFEEQDVLKWRPARRFHCIAANLFSDILIQALPRISRATRKGGDVLLSGILKTQAEDCLEAARDSGLQVEKVLTIGKWVSARARKL